LKSFIFFSIIFLAVVTVLVPSADAASIFLKLDGVRGDSSDDRHRDEIEIQSWAWGLSNTGGISADGMRDSGRAHFQDLTVTKVVDSASTVLMQHAANGAYFIEGKLTVLKTTSTSPIESEIITMKNVHITSISLGSSEGENIVTEQVTFNFEEVKVEYTPYDQKGSPGSPSEFNWNIVENFGDVSIGDTGATDDGSIGDTGATGDGSIGDTGTTGEKSVFSFGGALPQDLPPLKQMKSGISPENVQCKSGLELIQKPSGSVACVKSSSVSKLLERGWLEIS